MAGAGYKLFNTGDVLTAAQVNTYLMEQTVMVFANAAARTTALSGVVSEGMISYLKDTNAVEVYDGSNWVSSDDPNAIQNTIVDAKGDLITATAADTPARLAVGSNGDTLVADSAATTGLRWQGNYAAGKNAIINGDFRINQRNFTSATADNTYTFDRWRLNTNGGATFTPQTFTPGAAPVAGYEGVNFLRMVSASQSVGSDYVGVWQRIEDVRTFAGQTVTVSFWAKAGSGTPNIGISLIQSFGSGGSAAVVNSPAVKAITTSWARYSFTATLASVSGKTIGSSSSLDLAILTSVGSTISGSGYAAVGLQNATIDIWGVQVEGGSVATAFQTATGTIQGETALCQRYYEKSYNLDIAPGTTTDTGAIALFQDGSTSTNVQGQIFYKVTKRGTPTLTIYSPVGGATGNVYNNKTGGNAAATQLLNGASNGSFYTNIGTAGTGYSAKFHYVAELEL